MGLALAQAAFSTGRYVSWYPDYGPEQRGGTSNCTVVISGEPIGSPVASEPDILVAFNRPSLEKFAPEVKEGGIILYDTMAGDYQAPDGVRIVPIPALKIAQGKGAQQAINTAMFGALSELGDLGISRESFEKALAQSFAKKPKLVPLNLEIFKLGSEAARKEVGAKLKVAVVAR